ncbi:helix-turn-helix transcriptional regulator [Zophobihabitans entericus]|uniref:Helix-turn-helix transcriptional regulator n=1 Tax=Zophobihabitans entericus TaxID=1635327 RepID=A0A6G9I8A6_9GAMM|nr:AraC family transcriptional regulator [Zophobihabitans entericus]QIQ20445.1 helix-turn-helix transcriptional regulator [Zophobihabitans entericus]
MTNSIADIISAFISQQRKVTNLYLASGNISPPALAYQVDFPRLEIIIEGEVEMCWAENKTSSKQQCLSRNNLLYIPGGSWNQPQWSKPATTLSILFGKQQLGLSLLSWDGEQFTVLEQINTPRRGPRVGAFILQAIDELSWGNPQQPKTDYQKDTTAPLLILSLLSHTLDLLNTNIETSSHTTSLFEAIRHYIDIHFREEITREFLAKTFYISPNYLSHLFHKEGETGLNEYLNQVRLEHAKTLLKNYDLNIKEVAHACGFNDSNYFCRVFRKRTDRSPSEYRNQYHSKLVMKS